MYAYYCTFGEEKDPGNDFLAFVKNILRESLEGILTTSEVKSSKLIFILTCLKEFFFCCFF